MSFWLAKLFLFRGKIYEQNVKKKLRIIRQYAVKRWINSTCFGGFVVKSEQKVENLLKNTLQIVQKMVIWLCEKGGIFAWAKN